MEGIPKLSRSVNTCANVPPLVYYTDAACRCLVYRRIFAIPRISIIIRSLLPIRTSWCRNFFVNFDTKKIFHQEGHHDMSLEILGAGVVAKMVRGLVRGFNVKRRIKNFVTNEACLPRASRLPASVLFRIYGSYLAVWLMLLCQAYSQRLRRSISGFFYRKREKRRVLYLYNETLRRRLGFLRFARARVAKLARAHQLEPESRPFLTARLRWPKYFSWLQRFACSRRRCVVCGETEPRSGPEHRLCQTQDCFAVYCDECWNDIGQVCLACDRLQDSSGAEETAVETEYDEDDDDD